MPSFSRPLEETLHRAVHYANARRHEYATLEHLLLALIDDPDAANVMGACNVDLDALKADVLTTLQFGDGKISILHWDGTQAQIVLGMPDDQFRDMVVEKF